MRECSEVNANQHVHQAKRVSVRSGGAGHAQSGVIKGVALRAKDGETAPPKEGVKSPKQTNGKIVRLAR